MPVFPSVMFTVMVAEQFGAAEGAAEIEIAEYDGLPDDAGKPLAQLEFVLVGLVMPEMSFT